MAITKTQHQLLTQLPIRPSGSLLEIGEANWAGDLDPEAVGLRRSEDAFAIAKEFYAAWLSPSRSVAVDLNGTEQALRINLNHPLDLGEQFDVIINQGTAEHIFNIGQVFKSIHDLCRVDGWMIHDAPLLGWIDHGFYCLQPTLFCDLARANCYELHTIAIHEHTSGFVHQMSGRSGVPSSIPFGAMTFVAFRKRFDMPFTIPLQGYYAHRLGPETRKACGDV